MIGANNFAFPAYDVRHRVFYNDIAGSDLKIIIEFYREIRICFGESYIIGILE